MVIRFLSIITHPNMFLVSDPSNHKDLLRPTVMYVEIPLAVGDLGCKYTVFKAKNTIHIIPVPTRSSFVFCLAFVMVTDCTFNDIILTVIISPIWFKILNFNGNKYKHTDRFLRNLSKHGDTLKWLLQLISIGLNHNDMFSTKTRSWYLLFGETDAL